MKFFDLPNIAEKDNFSKSFFLFIFIEELTTINYF